MVGRILQVRLAARVSTLAPPRARAAAAGLGPRAPPLRVGQARRTWSAHDSDSLLKGPAYDPRIPLPPSRPFAAATSTAVSGAAADEAAVPQQCCLARLRSLGASAEVGDGLGIAYDVSVPASHGGGRQLEGVGGGYFQAMDSSACCHEVLRALVHAEHRVVTVQAIAPLARRCSLRSSSCLSFRASAKVMYGAQAHRDFQI